MKHCADERHTWTIAPDGSRHCTTCGLRPCAEGTHDLAIDPVHVKLHPPTYDAICRTCGMKMTWPPPSVQASLAPLTQHDDYARHAARFGHPLRRREAPVIPTPPCTVCGRPGVKWGADGLAKCAEHP